MLIVIAMTLLVLLFGGCRTVEQSEAVTEVRHDTVRIYTQKRDSVVYRDSVFVHVHTQGDTVYHVTERWNVRYNDRVRVDTVYKARDKGEIIRRVTKEKEEESKWLLIFSLAAVALVVATPFAFFKW